VSDESAITVTVQGNQYKVSPPFTNRELHAIKQITGVRAGEMQDALEAGDSDMIVALAHIAVRRSGANRPSLDDLWDLEAGAIDMTLPEDEEDGADPTEPAPESGSQETTPA
jgi:hypothetical protein